MIVIVFNFYISRIRGKAKEQITIGHKKYIKYFKTKYLKPVEKIKGSIKKTVVFPKGKRNKKNG